MIPTKERCLELQQEYNMFFNIRKHCQTVSNVSVYLGKALAKNNFIFNLDLIEASGYLHDITKSYHLVCEGFKLRGEEFEKWKEFNQPLVPLPYEGIISQWEEIKNDLEITESEGHSQTAKKLLYSLGYGNVGDVVGKHNLPLVEISEAGILCYADRIVGFDKVVDIETRFDYVLKRYGLELVGRLKSKTLDLEKVLLTAADLEFKKIQRDC